MFQYFFQNKPKTRPNQNTHSKPAKMSAEDFLLKWNDHHKLFFAGADEILSNQEFTDVTLSAGDKIFKAHKFVLSICSPYFQGLFRKLGPEKHVIFLKDISAGHLELLLQYMYRGEIKVRETELVTVLNVAQSLEVRGLTDNSETNKHEPEVGRATRRVTPPPPPPPSHSQSQSGAKRPGLSSFASPAAPVVKQETGGQTVIDVEQVGLVFITFPSSSFFSGSEHGARGPGRLSGPVRRSDLLRADEHGGRGGELRGLRGV